MFFSKARPLGRVGPVTKQMSLDGRSTQFARRGFEATGRVGGRLVSGVGRVRSLEAGGEGGGRVLGEGRGGIPGGGERAMGGGGGAVIGRGDGTSGGRGEAFRGVFGGAGGGLGSETGAGSNTDLWMRSDSLYSPPISPVPWLNDYPSSVYPGKASSGHGEPRQRKTDAKFEETGKETHSLIRSNNRTLHNNTQDNRASTQYTNLIYSYNSM